MTDLRKRLLKVISIVTLATGITFGLLKGCHDYRENRAFQTALNNLPKKERLVLEEKIKKGQITEDEFRANLVSLTRIRECLEEINKDIRMMQEEDSLSSRPGDSGNLLIGLDRSRRIESILRRLDEIRPLLRGLNPLIVTSKKDLERETERIERAFR